MDIASQNLWHATELVRGGATIALNDRKILNVDHPARHAAGESVGKRVEVVLVTERLRQDYDHVLASAWPVSTPITKQPWGMTDFRIVDPDGIYIRVTGPRDG